MIRGWLTLSKKYCLPITLEAIPRRLLVFGVVLCYSFAVVLWSCVFGFYGGLFALIACSFLFLEPVVKMRAYKVAALQIDRTEVWKLHLVANKSAITEEIDITRILRFGRLCVIFARSQRGCWQTAVWRSASNLSAFHRFKIYVAAG